MKNEINNCIVIAEAGVNHNGKLSFAKKLALVAKKSGADFVKFQIYQRTEQISKYANTASYQRKGSKEKKMLEMSKNYDLSWDDHILLKKYCNKIKIKYLASCFDKKSLNFYVNKLKGKIIKIGSGEITNYPLLKEIYEKKIQIILSTGMSNMHEINKALQILKKKNVTILHCTSSYPTDLKDVNLRALTTLKEKFKRNIGYSDHTVGNLASIASLALGAKVIEKHFTLNKKLPGPDHSMSLNPSELRKFIFLIRKTETLLGNSKKIPTKSELIMKKLFRRGIVASSNIFKGEKITKTNISLKRPATGIPAEKHTKIYGKVAKVNIKVDQPIKSRMIK